MSKFFLFNSYSSLLLPSFCHGLMFGFLSIRRYFKEQKQCDLFLGLLLLLLTIRISYWMLGFAGWYDTHDSLTSIMFYFPFNTYIYIGPCLYFYFLSFTNNVFTIKKHHYLHLILPMLFFILYVVKFIADYLLYYPFKISGATQYGTHGPFAQLDKSNVVYGISYVLMIYYSWLVLSKFKNYRIYLKQHFSDLSGIDFLWFRNLMMIIVAAMSLNFCFYLLPYFYSSISYQIKWYPYFILGFVIYYTAINGYFNNLTLFQQLHFKPNLYEKLDELTIAVTLPELDTWVMRLENLMTVKRLYLDPQLSLTILSKELGILPQALSKIINEGYKMNFNDYINNLRIVEITKQIESGAHKRFSLIGIAYENGFSSKTTFNRAFKKFKNCTPSEFIMNL